MVVVVEGAADVRFLSDFAKHTFELVLTKDDFLQIGTDWRGLDNQRTQIARRRDRGRRVLAILDADWASPNYNQGGFATRREALEDWFHQAAIECGIFLWPNDRDDGCLETMLEQIALSQHRPIFECFAKYEECIRASDPSYLTPNHKAKIYAYLEALGVDKEERGETKRDYLNKSAWNLDHDYLVPLRNFLKLPLR